MNEDLRTLMRTAINLALPILKGDQEMLRDTLGIVDEPPKAMNRVAKEMKAELDRCNRAIDYCERAIVADGVQP